jgi:hypothetical protein
MLTDNFTEEQHADIRFLMETMSWSFWPYTPLKRNIANKQQLAAVYDGEKGARTVYLGVNVFGLTPDALENAEKIEYPSSVAVVQDGWMVD